MHKEGESYALNTGEEISEVLTLFHPEGLFESCFCIFVMAAVPLFATPMNEMLLGPVNTRDYSNWSVSKAHLLTGCVWVLQLKIRIFTNCAEY